MEKVRLKSLSIGDGFYRTRTISQRPEFCLVQSHEGIDRNIHPIEGLILVNRLRQPIKFIGHEIVNDGDEEWTYYYLNENEEVWLT